MLLYLNSELMFTAGDVKKILLKDPRVFMIGSPSDRMFLLTLSLRFSDPEAVGKTARYLANVMNINQKLIAAYPLALRVPLAYIRQRHEFLFANDRAQYNPALPRHISLAHLLHPSDAFFSAKVSGASLDQYESFLKTR